MAPVTSFLRRMVLPLALGALGTALLHARFGAQAQVKNLLHPLLHPLVAGAGFLLVGAASLFLLFPPERPRAGWKLGRDAALALAVLLVLAAAPDSFSSLALANRAAADPSALLKGKADAAAEAANAVWQTDATGTIPLEVTDLYMAVGLPQSVAALEGKKVRLLGQADKTQDGAFHLVRFLMFCCAADAQPLALRVEGPRPAGLPEMGWAEATGTVHFRDDASAGANALVPSANGGAKQVPVLTLESAKAIPEPKDKFVY